MCDTTLASIKYKKYSNLEPFFMAVEAKRVVIQRVALFALGAAQFGAASFALEALRVIIFAADDQLRGRFFAFFGRDGRFTAEATRGELFVVILPAVDVLLLVAHHGLVVAGEIDAADLAVEAPRVEERVQSADDFRADFFAADFACQRASVSFLRVQIKT